MPRAISFTAGHVWPYKLVSLVLQKGVSLQITTLARSISSVPMLSVAGLSPCLGVTLKPLKSLSQRLHSRNPPAVREPYRYRPQNMQSPYDTERSNGQSASVEYLQHSV